jgi:hypothetical protein
MSGAIIITAANRLMATAKIFGFMFTSLGASKIDVRHRLTEAYRLSGQYPRPLELIVYVNRSAAVGAP